MARRIDSISSGYYERKLGLLAGARMFASLRRDVIRAGVLDRDYLYYLFVTPFDVGVLLSLLGLYFIQTNWVALTLISVGIAFFSVRIGGLIHDAGHRGVFRSPLYNDIYGYTLSGLIAFAYYAWKIKHNAHHAHTNEEDEDPDLDIPFKFLEDEAPPTRGISRFVHKHQVWLYYPLGSLVSLSTRLIAFRYYLGIFNTQVLLIMLVQAVGMFGWLVLPFILFSPAKALVFVVPVFMLSGFYLLNIFAPNHKGMPQIGKGVKLSFLEQQIVTSRNISRHWLTDYLYLGLNYQIEHHLFPSCPRRKLHKITPYTRKICRKHKLPYVEMGILASTQFIFNELHKASLLVK
jgi:fatty acid desaturase